MGGQGVTTDHQVVVVGFGPVGVTVAGLLARRGVDVLAIDRDTEIFSLPRAAHLDSEVMRVLQDLGCADAVAPALVENEGMDFLTADRQVLLRMRGRGDTASGWASSNFFHQPSLEVPMREAAIAAGAQVRLGIGVEAVHDLGDHVRIHLADGSSVTARYVVACDGARSLVRKQLGISMDDLGFEEPWLVLDTVLHPTTPLPTAVALQVCDPSRPHTLVPMPPPRFRFEFMVLPGDDPDELASESFARLLMSAWLDPAGVDIERSAVYTFHGLIATEWRRGNVLLAGDAAHQMPPFLGQGMCSGIRDAANLAWKLERVLRGSAADVLLDTYQAEREPHVRRIVESAVGFGRLICTTDHEVAAARDQNMLAARAAGGGEVGRTAGTGLPEGALVVADGQPSLQPTVNGQRLDDIVGPGFSVLRRTADADVSAWDDLDAVILDADTTPAISTVLDSLGAEVAVIRPDRYVMWTGAAGEPMPPTIRHLVSR